MLAQAPLTGLRYLGLAGSVVLAAGAVSMGALPGAAERDGVPALAQTPGMLACLGGLVALTAAWWRVGLLTSGPAALVLPGRWMVVTAALWALPLALAPPLASRDVYAYACQGSLLLAGLDPHAGGPALQPCRWLDSVPPIWRATPSPYGPLATLVSAGAAAGSGGHLAVAVGLLRLSAVAGIALAIWSGRRLARRCGVTGGKAAWLGLASPLVLVHAVSGAHNDALLTGLVVASLSVAAGPSRRPDQPEANPMRRAVLGGLVLGLAVAVKVTAALAIPFAVALLFTHAERVTWRRVVPAAAVVASAAAAGFSAVAAATGLGVGFVTGLARTGELAQWTSPPTAVGLSAGYALRAVGVSGGDDVAVAVARGVGLLAAVAVVVGVLVVGVRRWAGWAPRDRTRRALSGAAAAFVAMSLLGPVFYPWYALTPLALVAISTVDDRVRAWAGAVCALLVWLILPNGTGLAPRTKLTGALAVTAGIGAAIAGWVRRGRRRPVGTGHHSTRARQ